MMVMRGILAVAWSGSASAKPIYLPCGWKAHSRELEISVQCYVPKAKEHAAAGATISRTRRTL